MELPELLTYSGVLTALALIVFLFGFSCAGSVAAAEAGFTFGVFSAAAWASGSIGGPLAWNNWSNVFAAFFAVLSLGLLAPDDEACKGADGLFRKACVLRSSIH